VPAQYQHHQAAKASRYRLLHIQTPQPRKGVACQLSASTTEYPDVSERNLDIPTEAPRAPRTHAYMARSNMARHTMSPPGNHDARAVVPPCSSIKLPGMLILEVARYFTRRLLVTRDSMMLAPACHVPLHANVVLSWRVGTAQEDRQEARDWSRSPDRSSPMLSTRDIEALAPLAPGSSPPTHRI
jgi:hypothetical protein